MIPKDKARLVMLSLGECERLIDNAIEITRATKPDARVIYASLHPVEAAVVTAVVDLYKVGGWTVEVESLRTPNGFGIRLS